MKFVKKLLKISTFSSLIQLAEVLAQRNLAQFNRKPTMRTQKLDNISTVLNFFQKEEDIKIVNIGFNPGNLGPFLQFYWIVVEEEAVEENEEAAEERMTAMPAGSTTTTVATQVVKTTTSYIITDAEFSSDDPPPVTDDISNNNHLHHHHSTNSTSNGDAAALTMATMTSTAAVVRSPSIVDVVHYMTSRREELRYEPLGVSTPAGTITSGPTTPHGTLRSLYRERSADHFEAAAMVAVQGHGLQDFVPGQPAQFTVDASQTDFPCPKSLFVSVVTSHGPAEKVTVEHLGGGRYEVLYTVHDDADVLVFVKYGKNNWTAVRSGE